MWTQQELLSYVEPEKLDVDMLATKLKVAKLYCDNMPREQWVMRQCREGNQMDPTSSLTTEIASQNQNAIEES